MASHERGENENALRRWLGNSAACRRWDLGCWAWMGGRRGWCGLLGRMAARAWRAAAMGVAVGGQRGAVAAGHAGHFAVYDSHSSIPSACKCVHKARMAISLSLGDEKEKRKI